MRTLSGWVVPAVIGGLLAGAASASYVNFESSHVHPIDLTPSGTRLLAVNTPDAMLEVFTVQAGGGLAFERAIPVGLEPVTVVARSDQQAWVVNNLSDTVSIVDLDQGTVVRTLSVGDEPTDVAFAAGKAFVTASQEDAVKVFNLANLNAPPATVPLFGRDVRALAVSNDGQKVYAVVLRSGNQTTVVHAKIIFGNDANMNAARLTALGLKDMKCAAPGPPLYPALPAGIARNPALVDPVDGVPRVGLITRWNEIASQWQDEVGQDWTQCLPYRLPDNDLFVIDASSLAVTAVQHLGTSLFEVSVQPVTGRIYVPHTEARNFVRFEHPLGLRGHLVDDRLAVIDPTNANAVSLIDLNAHVNRGSDPASNLVERLASVSQPGMLAWRTDGSKGYLTAIGSRKLFEVNGGCLSGSCIFGPVRAAPRAVEVGEGPTGVVLHEGATSDADRLYVLNRIGHSIAVVAASTLTKLDEIALHDPSSESTRLGRRFLYDAIDTSAHGDASCASCHPSGDMDGLAWDLGNPEANLAPYGAPLDNVRFVIPQSGHPVECTGPFCAAHQGFDPQKGPMVTQTLRGMLEPLHWRGDRATVRDFNATFVNLVGAADLGPIAGKPAGVTAADMELLRQFALGIHLPPNPYRTLEDGTRCGTRLADPNCEVAVHGSLFPGNPTEGARIFDEDPVDSAQPCVACHAHSFGTAGGKLGGVEPTEPTSPDAAALFFGTADDSPHSDLKISHLRNLYDKFGPVWAAPGAQPEQTTTGFGYNHDGSVPDLFRFLCRNLFFLDAAAQAQTARDLAAFLFHFPTETRPAVGRQVTLPPGAPPTGSLAEEQLLVGLTALGNLSDPARHCELVASTRANGRARRYHLSGATWVADAGVDAPLTFQALRAGAQAPITFTCVTLGSGLRLGGDRDEDLVLDGDDCAPADAEAWGHALTVADLGLHGKGPTTLTWFDQSSLNGPAMRYDVLGGALSELRAAGLTAVTCIAGGLDQASYLDAAAAPDAGEGRFYLIRARNPCGTASLGPGAESLETLECTVP